MTDANSSNDKSDNLRTVLVNNKFIVAIGLVLSGATGSLGAYFWFESFLQSEVSAAINKHLVDLKGEKGDRGEKGDKGNPGKDGIKGVDGRPGSDADLARYVRAYTVNAGQAKATVISNYGQFTTITDDGLGHFTIIFEKSISNCFITAGTLYENTIGLNKTDGKALKVTIRDVNGTPAESFVDLLMFCPP